MIMPKTIDGLAYVGIFVFLAGCSPTPEDNAWIAGTWLCEGVENLTGDKHLLRSVVMQFDPNESDLLYETFGTAALRTGADVPRKRLVKEGGRAILKDSELNVSYQYRTKFDASGESNQVLAVGKTYNVQRNAEVMRISASAGKSTNTVSYDCSKSSDNV